MTNITENNIINKFLKPLSHKKIARQLQDDSAQIPKGNYIISTDTITQNTHFLEKTPPQAIAHRLLASNLSDMAGSAAIPQYYLLNLALTQKQNETWINEFCKSLKNIQKKYNIKLIGGDTIQSQHLTLSATILGTPMLEESPTRQHAQPNDIIYTTGTIGSAYIGLLSLKNELTINIDKKTIKACQEKFLFPEPRNIWAKKITEFLQNDLHALTDISDGLASDAEKIAIASKVSINIELHRIPLLNQIKNITNNNHKLLYQLIAGGDDYELLFSIPQTKQIQFNEFCQKNNIGAHHIGYIKPKIKNQKNTTQFILNNQPVKLNNKGWQHFQNY